MIKQILPALLALVLATVACGDDGEEPPPPPPPKPTCTAAQTTTFVEDDGLVALLATAADQATKDVLKDMVINGCCPSCPTGSATARPLVAVMKGCVSCAGGYASGNPASHVTNCTTQVCQPSP